MVGFEPNTDDPAPANEKLGSFLKASGCAALAARAENVILFVVKKLVVATSSFFWVLSDCFELKTFTVVVAVVVVNAAGLPNGEELLPNVIFEKGILLVPNGELLD